MDSRKGIQSVSAGEKITHTGDLTIEGDINEQAEVTVKDGIVVVLGEVKAGAKINLNVSEELRNSFPSANVINNISSIAVGLGNISFHGGGSYTQANVSMSVGNKTILMGNVNINGRIHTDDQVTELGGGQYKITPASDSPYGNSIGHSIAVRINGVKQLPHTVNGYATAKVDGKTYQGKEITIDRNYNVLVDGKSPSDTADLNASSQKSNKSKEIPKLIIHGNIGTGASIQSDADIEVKGIIGAECEVNSKYGTITAHNVLAHTCLKACNDIVTDDISAHVQLSSTIGNVTVKNVADNAILKARDEVKIEGQAANNCTINSSMGGLHANKLGEKTTISVRDNVHVSELGVSSVVTISMGSFHGDKVANHTQITSREGVRLKNAGDGVRIASSMNSVKVESQVGEHAVIQAREVIIVGHAGQGSQLTSTMDKVSLGSGGNQVTVSAREEVLVRGSLGQNARVTSSMDKVSVQSVGAHSSINAREGVRIGEVGEHSVINVSMDKAVVGKLGSYVTISARENITVEACCPKSAILTSTMGKVKKSQGVYDDLAEKQRVSSSVTQAGIFAASNAPVEPSEAERERAKRVLWESMIWPNLQKTDPALKSMIESACTLSSGETPYSVWQRVFKEMNETNANDMATFKKN